jgi:hypothetical protein
MFKDNDAEYEIEAVITKRERKKDFIMESLLNGEDIDNYYQRRRKLE